MSDNLRFPNGVSVAQAKKDAKSLARAHGMLLAEAQNQVAKANGLDMLWSRAIERLKLLNQPLACLQLPLRFSLESLPLAVPFRAPAMLLAGPSGTGKSVFAVALAAQQLRGHTDAELHWITDRAFPTIGSSLPETWVSDNLLQALMHRHGSRIKLHGRDYTGDLPGNGSPPGTVIVLDEVGYCDELPEIIERWISLAQQRRHILIVCAQVLSEVVRGELPPSVCTLFHARPNYPEMSPLPLIQGLTRKLNSLRFERGRFSEFLAVDGSGPWPDFVRLPLPCIHKL
ncbi:hypothetical protein HX798_20580 [Pseudomonas putida]|uniref:Uncharacterized protein n=1 Tax=Pseudomonas putida TaxID=303 RepID=A0A7Y7ZEP8_PSEPU|nr:hypothetical protein [Pseudomonas putida]NWC82665.1 hypothetical protein [Pseudomonas putida]